MAATRCRSLTQLIAPPIMASSVPKKAAPRACRALNCSAALSIKKDFLFLKKKKQKDFF
jgi:hypothetical protein